MKNSVIIAFLVVAILGCSNKREQTQVEEK